MSVDMSVDVRWADTPKPKNPQSIWLCISSINRLLVQLESHPAERSIHMSINDIEKLISSNLGLFRTS